MIHGNLSICGKLSQKQNRSQRDGKKTALSVDGVGVGMGGLDDRTGRSRVMFVKEERVRILTGAIGADQGGGGGGKEGCEDSDRTACPRDRSSYPVQE